ncbi:hypothetical protein [Streptomyces reniochalinae]|uniref:hypothetical protein n=1 Tax=Streptomyces reniochalinae TaxID=2250578 RepID=UPI0011C01B54|nr:hypothetical protein [Streptomyces reniochalinae]
MTDPHISTEAAPTAQVGNEDRLTAVHDLREAMRQAGIGKADLLVDGKTCAISADDAAGLAGLVRKGIAETFEACTELATCLRTHGLEMDEPYVTGDKINLGTVTVPVAAALALLLGAPREEIEAEYDECKDLSRWGLRRPCW